MQGNWVRTSCLYSLLPFLLVQPSVHFLKALAQQLTQDVHKLLFEVPAISSISQHAIWHMHPMLVLVVKAAADPVSCQHTGTTCLGGLLVADA